MHAFNRSLLFSLGVPGLPFLIYFLLLLLVLACTVWESSQSVLLEHFPYRKAADVWFGTWTCGLSRSNAVTQQQWRWLSNTVTPQRPLFGKRLQLSNQFSITDPSSGIFLFAFFLRRPSQRRRTMKQDLSLSLLSRGCGQFVSSDRHEGGEDGRLDVCFTPQVSTTAASPISVASPSCKTSLWARRVSRSTYQVTGAPGAEFTCKLEPSSNGWYSCAHHRQDYYSWKSQDALLQLSNSGRLLAETQSAMPKTFSTRRGPLLLFSQVTCRLARLPNKLLLSLYLADPQYKPMSTATSLWFCEQPKRSCIEVPRTSYKFYFHLPGSSYFDWNSSLYLSVLSHSGCKLPPRDEGAEEAGGSAGHTRSQRAAEDV